MNSPEEMRLAMASYVRGIHHAYLEASAILPPADRARLPLLVPESLTVAAVGTRVLHIIGTAERLPDPRGPEVEIAESLDDLHWTLRFFDPVVIPALGLIDETPGPAQQEVRRVLGIRTVLYHLAVPPGASLTEHHATHAGTGLAHAHAAAARDFDAIRAYVPQRTELIDEMQGAAIAGLDRAQVLLARAIAPGIEGLEIEPPTDSTEARRTLLAAVRPARTGA